MMSAPLKAMPAWNGAIASSSLRLKAPGGTEVWACASPPLALTVVWLDDSCVADDRLTPSLATHVGSAALRTSMGRGPVHVLLAGSPAKPVDGLAGRGGSVTTSLVVLTVAGAVLDATTLKPKAGWRRSKSA